MLPGVTPRKTQTNHESGPSVCAEGMPERCLNARVCLCVQCMDVQVCMLLNMSAGCVTCVCMRQAWGLNVDHCWEAPMRPTAPSRDTQHTLPCTTGARAATTLQTPAQLGRTSGSAETRRGVTGRRGHSGAEARAGSPGPVQRNPPASPPTSGRRHYYTGRKWPRGGGPLGRGGVQRPSQWEGGPGGAPPPPGPPPMARDGQEGDGQEASQSQRRARNHGPAGSA